MRRIRKHAKFIRALFSGNGKTKRILLKKANRGQFCSICELIKNVNKGNVPLSPQLKGKLCKYKRHLRKLADRNIKFHVKKKLVQKGGQRGGIPLIPILSMLAPVVGKLFSGIFGSKD